MSEQNSIPDRAYLWHKLLENPTIENFLNIRAEFPDAEMGVRMFGSIDNAFKLERELQEWGIDPNLFCGILDADSHSIRLVCRLILENMIKIRDSKHSKRTHISTVPGIIPPHVSDWLLACMFGALSWAENIDISPDLLATIQFRLFEGA